MPMSEDGKQGRETAKSTCYVAEPLSAVTDPIELAALGALSLSPDDLIRRARNHNKHSKKKQKKDALVRF